MRITVGQPHCRQPTSPRSPTHVPFRRSPRAASPCLPRSLMKATVAGSATEPQVPRRAGGRPATGEEAIRLEGVTRMFAGLTALRDVSLWVPRGAIVGVIGPSGAGKTTAIRLLTGALAPTRGTVRVLGEDPRHFRRQTRERIGYMPQLFTLYPDLTASENVNFMGFSCFR